MYETGKGTYMSGGQQPLSGHRAMGTSMSVKQPPVPYKMVDQGISETPLRRPLAPIKLGARWGQQSTVSVELTPIYGSEGSQTVPAWPRFGYTEDATAEWSARDYTEPGTEGGIVVIGVMPNPDKFPMFQEFYQRLISGINVLRESYGGGMLYPVTALEDSNYVAILVNTGQARSGTDYAAYETDAKNLFLTTMAATPLPGSTVPPDPDQVFDPDQEVDPGFSYNPIVDDPIPTRSSNTSAAQTLPAPVTDSATGEPKKLPWLPILLGIGALGFAGWAIWSRSIR